MSALCPPGKIWNPNSKRCILIGGKTARALLRAQQLAPPTEQPPAPAPTESTACPAGKVLLPESGECVSIKSRAGRAVLKAQQSRPRRTSRAQAAAVPEPAEPGKVHTEDCKYGKTYNKSTDSCDCPDGKINNPESMRCVQIAGKIAQQILQKQKRQEEMTIKPIPKPPTPEPFSPYIRRVLPPNFRIHDSDVEEEEVHEEEKKATKLPANSCPPNKIRNPVSGRCVKKTSLLGQAIERGPRWIQLPRCKRVTGPMSLSYHASSVYGKQIIIIGDAHNPGASCKDSKGSLEISVWIHQLLIKNPYVLFDLFLEKDTDQSLYDNERMYKQFGINYAPFPSSLQKTINLFAPHCRLLGYANGEGASDGGNSQRLPDVCSYANMRVHYSDIRSRYLAPYEFLSSSIHAIYVASFESEARLQGCVSKFLESETLIMHQLAQINVKKLKERCGITDLLSRIKDKRVVRVIDSTFSKYAKNLELLNVPVLYREAHTIANLAGAQGGKAYVERLKLESNISVKGFFNPTRIMALVVSKAAFMDWYIAAGMFSEYPLVEHGQPFKEAKIKEQMADKKKTRAVAEKEAAASRETNYTPEPRFIILHEGNAHAEQHRKLLRALHFAEETFSLIDGMDRCVDISLLKSKLPIMV